MPRLFTLEEAEALLPRLAPLVTRMQELKATYDQLMEAAVAYGQTARTNGNPPAAPLDREQFEAVTSEINAAIEEITSHGCEVKDLNMGLLDFRSELDGREVNLCWKLGEPRIEWWHELHSGFASRQPLERGDLG